MLQQFDSDGTFPGQAAGGGAGAPDATWLGLARRLKRLLEYYAQDGRSGRLRAARQAVLPLLDPALHLAVAAHFGQFVAALGALGSDADAATVLPQALAAKIIGCVACGEADPAAPWLSQEGGVQTTASWLEEADEILLETPPFGAPHITTTDIKRAAETETEWLALRACGGSGQVGHRGAAARHARPRHRPALASRRRRRIRPPRLRPPHVPRPAAAARERRGAARREHGRVSHCGPPHCGARLAPAVRRPRAPCASQRPMQLWSRRVGKG